MAEWRVGRSQLRTIYRDDVLVGLMDSPEIAAEVVAALNGREPCRSISGGSLRLKCVLPAGHATAHQSGGATWGQAGLVYRPDAVRCPTCGDEVRRGRFDSYGQHPRTGQAKLCPGPGRKDAP